MQRLLFAGVLILGTAITTFAGTEIPTKMPTELTTILNEKSEGGRNNSKETNLRLSTVRETGLRLGIQTGASWRYGKIEELLKKKTTILDDIFGFKSLIIKNKIAPPVIIQSKGTVDTQKNISVETDTSYKIIEDAHFISVPPSWRDYLLSTNFEVQEVDPLLFPRDSTEEKAWKEAIKRGWNIGIAQAESVFKLNLRRLERDIRGMILFNGLYQQGYVSLPEISTGRFAIRIGKKTLDLNQKSFMITNDSHFQDVKKWKPFLMSP